MGIMKLLEATVKTVITLPVAATIDVVTFGQGGTRFLTKETLEEIHDDIDKIGD